MLRALLLVVTVISGLAAALLLTLSPRIDYGAFALSGKLTGLEMLPPAPGPSGAAAQEPSRDP